jgi:hypothetical protein
MILAHDSFPLINWKYGCKNRNLKRTNQTRRKKKEEEEEE